MKVLQKLESLFRGAYQIFDVLGSTITFLDSESFFRRERYRILSDPENRRKYNEAIDTLMKDRNRNEIDVQLPNRTITISKVNYPRF